MNLVTRNFLMALLFSLPSTFLFGRDNTSPNIFVHKANAFFAIGNILMDTIPPKIDSIPSPILTNVGKECKTKISINNCFATDAGGIASSSFQLKKKNANIIVLSGSTYPSEIEIAEADFADYTLSFTVTDLSGNKATKSIDFAVKDVKKPIPICYNGLSVDLMPTSGSVLVGHNVFDAGSYDNCGSIEVFIQVPTYGASKDISKLKIDYGTNGKTSRDSTNKIAKMALFNCTGPTPIVLWAKDKAGNWDFCETYIDVQNNMNAPNVTSCKDKGTNKISIKIKKENGDPANGFVNFHFDPSTIGTPLQYSIFSKLLMQPNTINGETFNFAVSGENRFINVFNNLKPNNGVSTADLVIFSKHILGTELIKSKYRLAAADVNNSGKISTADLVETRKVVLGLLGGFSTLPSWRFFSDTTFNQFVTLKNIQKDTLLKFVAVKTGDLNDSAKGLKANEATERGENDVTYFEHDEKIFNAGEEIIFAPKSDAIEGYQTTIQYDKTILQLIDIQEESDNFFVKENGLILVSEVFLNQEKKIPSALKFRALKTGKLSENLTYSFQELASESYQDEVVKTLKLRFNAVEKVDFELFQNQPNPFLNETTINFFSPKKTNATLAIFDLNNRLIHSESMICEKGKNKILYQSNQLQQGIYRYQINIDGVVKSQKMIRL